MHEKRQTADAYRRVALRSVPPLLAALVLACGEVPPPASGSDPSLPAELALRRLAGGRHALITEISGAEHQLLLDLGSGLTLLTAPRAAELGCRPWGRLRLHDQSGALRDYERCGDLSLRLGPLSLSPVAGVLAPAPAALEATGLGGVASFQTLGTRPFTLDLAAARLVIESPESLERRVVTMRPIEARLGREAGGVATRLFLGIGTARGNLWFLVTSSGDRVAIAPHALDLLGLPTGAEPGTLLELSLDLPGLGRVDRPAVVREGPWDGVLDGATLEQLVLSADPASGRAWASLRTPPDPIP
jgi:hypothetical protein